MEITVSQLLDLRLRAQRLYPATGRQDGSLADMLGEVGGLQAQDAPAAVLGVRARSRGMTARKVEQARVGERSIVRTGALRGTLHLLKAEDAAWLLPLLGLRFVNANRGRRAQLGLDDAATDKGVDVIRETLRERGPQSRAELRAALARRGVAHEGQATVHLIACAALRGVCVYGPKEGREMLMALLDDWAPAARPAPLGADAALAELARRCLRALGPAQPEDLAQWAGVNLGEARQGFAAIARDIREVRMGGEAWWLLRGRADWLKAKRGRTPVVRLLPAFDNYLIAYANRKPYLDSAHAPQVMDGGIIRPTILVNGVVRGLWKTQRRKGGAAVELRPFTALKPAEARAAAVEAEDVRRFLEG